MFSPAWAHLCSSRSPFLLNFLSHLKQVNGFSTWASVSLLSLSLIMIIQSYDSIKNLMMFIRSGLATCLPLGMPPSEMILMASLASSLKVEFLRISTKSFDRFERFPSTVMLKKFTSVNCTSFFSDVLTLRDQNNNSSMCASSRCCCHKTPHCKCRMQLCVQKCRF